METAGPGTGPPAPRNMLATMLSHQTKTIIQVALSMGLVVGSMLLTVHGVEWLSRFYYYGILEGTGISTKEFRLSRPAPYRKAAYFSAEFVEESLKAPGGWKTPPGTRLVLPKDYQGSYINVRGGFRVTMGQPSNPSNTVWLLGGSTTFNNEVPDGLTIASLLQGRLNSTTPGKWRVVNAGATSVHSGQEVERLRILPIRCGDMVVFYDGVNDIVQGVFYGRPEGWMVGTNREMASKDDGRRPLAYRISKKMRKTMPYFFYLFSPRPVPEIPAASARADGRARLAARTAVMYAGNIQAAADYARSRGARFFHFLQPNLFTGTGLTDYERKVMANPELVLPGIAAAFADGNPALRAQVEILRRGGVKSFDITRLLSRRSGGEEFYLDFCHVNDRANNRVAEEIFKTIQPYLSHAPERLDKSGLTES